MRRRLTFPLPHDSRCEALESGEAERLGLDWGFVKLCRSRERSRRARHPFPDGVARALAGEANLRKLAGAHDPFDRGTSPAGFT
jgi:hypothetical protein